MQFSWGDYGKLAESDQMQVAHAAKALRNWPKNMAR